MGFVLEGEGITDPARFQKAPSASGWGRKR